MIHILEESLDYSALEQEDKRGIIVCRAKIKRCSLRTCNELDSAGKKCRHTLWQIISGKHNNQLLSPVKTAARTGIWEPHSGEKGKYNHTDFINILFNQQVMLVMCLLGEYLGKYSHFCEPLLG